MYILIIYLPFISFIAACAFGRLLGRQGCAWLTTICMVLTWFISIYAFYEVCLNQAPVILDLYDWLIIGAYSITFGFLFDGLSTIMVIVVISISTLVHLYSIGYMESDPHISRFMGYLSLFTFFMIILVTSSNFLQMFIGWEGVGVCSYLLINFWFTRVAANKAALKAMIINRIADVFFIIAILYIYLVFKTTDYITVFTLVPYMTHHELIVFGTSMNSLGVIAFFLVIGALGKSAQIGLHTWLPDAMEGPTPVSALLHAATMVTAGVFLIIRCSIFMEYNTNILFLLTIFGGITALFAGFVAIYQFDIKKVIAYSTCSQLGYMFFSCGLSQYHIAFSHSFNHAFFKALLFLAAGSVIHSLFNEQDMRPMGYLKYRLPFTYICFIIGSLAIMGFPLLTGFYSKDIILETTYTRLVIDASFIYTLGLLSAIFTATYSIRLLDMVFGKGLLWFRGPNTYLKYFVNGHFVECPWPMFIAMYILAFASIFIGYLFSDLLLGQGTTFWSQLIYISPANFTADQIFIVGPFVRNLPIISSLLAIISYRFFINYRLNVTISNEMSKSWIGKDKLSKFLDYIRSLIYVEEYINVVGYLLKMRALIFPIIKVIQSFGYHAGFFNNIYDKIFIKFYKNSYIFFTKYMDKGLFELYGPFGIYKIFRQLSLKSSSGSARPINYNIFLIIILSSYVISIYWLLNFYIIIFNFLSICIIALFCIILKPIDIAEISTYSLQHETSFGISLKQFLNEIKQAFQKKDWMCFIKYNLVFLCWVVHIGFITTLLYVFFL